MSDSNWTSNAHQPTRSDTHKPVKNATIPASLTPNESLQCFACSHTYVYVGNEDHPGVCPDCGSRAVSFAGDPHVVNISTQATLNEFGHILEVAVEDATERLVIYYVALGQKTRPTINAIRYEDTRFIASGDGWTRDLVPEIVLDAIEDDRGERPHVPKSEARR